MHRVQVVIDMDSAKVHQVVKIKYQKGAYVDKVFPMTVDGLLSVLVL